MMKGTTKHICVGARVQIPAYSDLWMRGARFGAIARVAPGKGRYLQAGDVRGADMFGVRMDHPSVKALHWFIADDCAFVEMQRPAPITSEPGFDGRKS
jgi:hypothetical protein